MRRVRQDSAELPCTDSELSERKPQEGHDSLDKESCRGKWKNYSKSNDVITQTRIPRSLTTSSLASECVSSFSLAVLGLASFSSLLGAPPDHVSNGDTRAEIPRVGTSSLRFITRDSSFMSAALSFSKSSFHRSSSERADNVSIS